MSEVENFLIKSLDGLIDVSELENCHLEICAGIAKSKTNLSSRVVPHYEMQGSFEKVIEYKSAENARIGNVANDDGHLLSSSEEKNYFDELTHEQKKRFMQLYKNAYCDGEFVRLKFTRNEFLQNPFATFHDSMCEWHANSVHFPKTLAFIKSLPFSEIGRVLIFVSYHYLHSDVHYDRKDICFDGKHHFVWFNPNNQKDFFLVDDESRKHPITSKAAFFNTRYLHGASPAPKMTYSLRVDGQLNEEFCKKSGIAWTPR